MRSPAHLAVLETGEVLSSLVTCYGAVNDRILKTYAANKILEEEWYFSVVDVVRVLTDSKDPTAYWRKLKQRLKDEGNETVTNCHGLKMTAPD